MNINMKNKREIFIIIILSLSFLVGMGIVYKNYIVPITESEGYEIAVNNELTSNLGTINKNCNIVQTFKTSSSFSGIGIRFSTYSKVNKGTIKAKLINLDTSEELQTWNIDTQDLKDNSFYNFKLEKVIDNSDVTNYELSLDISMDSQEDYITITTSDTNMYLDGDLSINGESKENDLSIVVYSKDSTFLRTIFIISVFIILIFIIYIYFMIFVRKSRIENIFMFSALVLGVMYVFIQTPYSSYDESAHVETAYRLSNKFLGIEDSKEKEGDIYIRAEDSKEGLSDARTTISTYKTVYDKLVKSSESNELIQMKARNVSEVKYVYLPTAIAITLGRIINMGQIQILIFGRLSNLICFILVSRYAIKKIPFAKMIIFTAAMLPMTLHQAASFSYDGPINGIAFLFIAYTMRLAYNDKKLVRKDYILFFIILILLAPLKKVYILMISLILIIPKKKFKSVRQYKVFMITAFIFAILSYLFFNVLEAITIIKQTDSVSVFSTEPAYTVSTIIHYPFWYMKILLNSFHKELIGFFESGFICIYLVETSRILTYIFIILGILSALAYDKEKIYIKGKDKLLFIVFIIVIVTALYTAGFLWTSVGKDIIQGVQGRYIIPFIPIILLLFRMKKVRRTRINDRILMFSIITAQIYTIYYIFVKILLNS